MDKKLLLDTLKEKFPNCRFERCPKKKETKVYSDDWKYLKTIKDKKGKEK